MTSPTQFHVFLSAVSSEFRQERVELENWLERKGLHVSSQEKFNQGGSTLWQKLYDEVVRCQAVICVMGMEPGWPSSGELPPGAPERSWTQWEFWLAWGEAPWSPPRRDKVFVFFPADLEQRMEKARQAALGDNKRLHELDLQQAHIDRVKQTNKHYSTFTNADDLIKQCLVLDLPTISRGKPSNLKYATLGSLFKGRDEKLEELHRRLTAGTGTRQVIYGLGGAGKTRLAIEYALRHSEEYQALLFIPADKREALDRNLATLCGPLILDLPEQDAKEEAARYHAVLRWLQAHQNWLLVLDNVDTAEAAEAVDELVRGLQGGTILITSRLADWSSEIPTLELDELVESAAVEFLLERTHDRRHHAHTDEKDAHALAHELGRLALALEQAGAFIAQKRSSLADYLARWRQRDQAVQEWNDERLTKYPRAVVTTWDTTVEQLSPEGLALLRQLSWLAPEPIPRSLLPDGPAQDALAELASFSLAKFEEGGGRFRIHRLVQDVTRERLSRREGEPSVDSSTGELSLYSILKILFDAITAKVTNHTDVLPWLQMDQFLPHLSAATTYANQHGIAEPTVYLMGTMATSLFHKGNYKEAELLMRRALKIREKTHGASDPGIIGYLISLATMLVETNRLKDAENLMLRALTISEASYEPNHPLMANVLLNLGALLHESKRYEEAELRMRMALVICEASDEPDHFMVSQCLNNLAQLLADTNRLEEAEPLMRRALAIKEAHYGQDHPSVMMSLHNLARLLADTNRLEEAEPLMRRALAINEARFGPSHPHVARNLDNLAQLLADTNRLEEAEPLISRALVINELIYGPDHPKVANNLNSLAQVLSKKYQLSDKGSLIWRMLKRRVGLNPLKLHTEVEQLMRRALAIDEASYGMSHTTVACDLNNLALLLRRMNRLREALSLQKRCVLIYLKDYRQAGHAHVNLVSALASYSAINHEMFPGLDDLGLILLLRKDFKDEAGLDSESFKSLLTQLSL